MVKFSTGVQWTRGLLFIMNIIFLLVGLAVLGLGVYIKANGNFNAISEVYSISESLGGEAMQWVAVGMIIAGVLTSCLAGLGCIGSIKMHRCFLYVYSLFLILIIIFEFAAVIIILVFRNNLWQTYESGFMEIFHHAYEQNQTETIKIIENIEVKFKCCGVNGPSDYRNNSYPIPDSCCPQQSSMFHPYSKGCAKAVINWISNELPIVAGSLGGILFIEIFGVVSALVLGVAISHSVSTERNHYSKI